MATPAASPGNDGLDALFEASPDLGVHTSPTAESGLILGLVALVAAPFSVMHSVALVTALLGALLAFRGVVATSSANVAGRALAPWGLACSIVALLVVALRYIGLDTAFGDDLLPSIQHALEKLDSRIPQP